MTFSLNIMARELAACISAANVVTDGGAKIPVLKSTHISIKGGEVTFIATNTDQTVSCVAACVGEGTTLLDTAMLLQKAAVASVDVPVSFEGDDKAVTVTQGRAKWKMPALRPDEFPLLVAAEIDAAPVTVVGRDLCAALAHAREAILPKSPNILGGAYFDFANGLHIVGGSPGGFHVCQVPGFERTDREGFVIPETSIQQIITLFQGAASCELRWSEAAFSIKSERLSYRSKLMPGKFPPYRNLITEQPGRILVDSAELAQTLKRGLAIKDDGKSLKLVLKIDNDISVVVTNAEGEESLDVCRADHQSGAPADIIISSVLLQKALGTLDCDTLQIDYTDRTKPIFISPVGADVENLRVVQARYL